MAGTKAGAAKAKKTILKKHGKNFFATIGQTGGKATGVAKGFAANPTLAAAAGRKGGRKSTRRKVNA